MIHLRDYQLRDVEAIRTSFGAGHRAVCYVAPTGSGKTVLFTHIAARLMERGKRAWILCHRQELMAQTSRALTSNGVDHAMVSPQFSFDPHARIQVASIMTLIRRLDKLPAPDLVIVDECHHGVSETWSRAINAHASAKVLGVTATPERLDGKGLGAIFQAMVLGPSVRTLTDQGYLARATVFAPPMVADLRGLHKRGGDYAQDELAEAMDRPAITGDAVEHYARICPAAPAIVYAASVVHAEHVAERFKAAGFRAASVDGGMDNATRKARIGGLASGEIQVLTSCDLISEGLDIPAVAAAILLRPTQSLSLCRQQIGRVLRPSPGKDRAIILDHAGNVLRHGLPTDDIEWTLEGSAAKRKKAAEKNEVQIRQCPQCYVVHEPAPVCPGCGHVYEGKPREIAYNPGTLEELTPEMIAARKAKKKAEFVKARTREQLTALARERGYHPAWVDRVLEHRREYAEKYRRNYG